MTRIDELTAKLLDGTLHDAEWAELELLLTTDAAAEVAHISLLELEGILRGLRTGFDLSEPTIARVKEVQGERTTQAVMAEIATRPTPGWADHLRRGRSHRRWWVATAGLLAVAAALIIGLWLGNGGNEPRGDEDTPLPAPIFAKLTRTFGTVELLDPQGDVQPADVGGDVPPGHTIRTVGEDSLAQVQLPDLTTVDIEPDSVVRFLTPGGATAKPRLFLAAGQLIAAVPDGLPDRQLVVGTGVADVFTRKGKYVFSSVAPESARVDIKQGNVEVVRRNAPAPVRVARGSAVMRSGLDKVFIEPAVRVDSTAARTLAFPVPRAATFSPDGSEIWVASSRRFTRWTRDGGTADTTLPPRKGTAAGPIASFTSDKSLLLATFFINKEDKGTGARAEKVLLRNLPDGQEQRVLDIKLSEARFWTVGPHAEWFALAEPKPNHKRLRILDGAGSVRFTYDFVQLISCVASSADGNVLAVGQTDPARIENNKIVLLDPTTGRRLSALPTQRRGLAALAFSPDGRYLAAGFNGLVQVWDVRSRELVKSISGFERVVTCLTFTNDSTAALAGGTRDGQVWIWSLASGRPVQLIEVGARGIRALAFSPDGRRLVTVANAPQVALWEVVDPAVWLQGDAE